MNACRMFTREPMLIVTSWFRFAKALRSHCVNSVGKNACGNGGTVFQISGYHCGAPGWADCGRTGQQGHCFCDSGSGTFGFYFFVGSEVRREDSRVSPSLDGGRAEGRGPCPHHKAESSGLQPHSHHKAMIMESGIKSSSLSYGSRGCRAIRA